MSKKNKGRNRKAVEQALAPREDQQPKKIVKKWDKYFNEGELEDWQRLMGDLGFEEEFTSKSQCRKALKRVWVNIHDFLAAVSAKKPVHHFRSERALAAYTKETGKVYPKNLVPKGSPLRRLLAHIDGGGGGSDGVDEITRMLAGGRII